MISLQPTNALFKLLIVDGIVTSSNEQFSNTFSPIDSKPSSIGRVFKDVQFLNADAEIFLRLYSSNITSSNDVHSSNALL